MQNASSDVANARSFQKAILENRGMIDCIISGAGISVASGCPSGDSLKGYLWGMLCGAYEDTFAFKQELYDIRSEVETSYFRMEQLVDILYLGDDKNKKSFNHAFHGAYEILLCGYQANRAHWCITNSPNVKHILTLNMDLLLEQTLINEDPRQVIHLHGTADIRESIITTPGEYLSGLPERLKRSFQEAVEGKVVLVVGYSGRDCDVMPLFNEFPPKKIIWLQHSDNYNTKPLEIEAQNLASSLNLKRPGTLEVIYGDSTQFLESLSGSCFPQKNRYPTVELIENRLKDLSCQLRNVVDMESRLIATGMVLYELKKYTLMQKILNKKFINPKLEYQRMKLLSRAEKRCGKYSVARRYLHAFPFSKKWMMNAIETIDTYRLEKKVAKAALLSRAAYTYARLIRLFFLFRNIHDQKLTTICAKLAHQLARVTTLAGNMKKGEKYLEFLCRLLFLCDLDEYFTRRPDWKPVCKNYGAYILALFHERLSMLCMSKCQYTLALFAAQRYLDIAQYSQPSVQALAWRSILTIIMGEIILLQKPVSAELLEQFAGYEKNRYIEYLSDQNHIWGSILELEIKMISGNFSCEEAIRQFERKEKPATAEAYSDFIHNVMLSCWKALKESRCDITEDFAHLLPTHAIKKRYFANYSHWVEMIQIAFKLFYGEDCKSKLNRLLRAKKFFARNDCAELLKNSQFLLNKIIGNERVTEFQLLRVIFILP